MKGKANESGYVPPFTVSAEAITLIAEISAQIERYAIGESSRQGQSGPFIDFMLAEIFKTLKSHQGEPLPNKDQEQVPNKTPNKVPNKLKAMYPDFSDVIWSVYMGIKTNPHATAEELGLAIGISGRMVRKHIATLREAGLIERIGSNKTGYWKVHNILKRDR